MTRVEKTVAALVAKMDADGLRDLAALALRGVEAVALLTETAEERTRRLDRERKKRTRAGQSTGQPADSERTKGGHGADYDRTLAGHVSALEGDRGGGILGISRDFPGESSGSESSFQSKNHPSDHSQTLSQPGSAGAREAAPMPTPKRTRRGSTEKPTRIPLDGAEFDAWVIAHGFGDAFREHADEFMSFVRHHRGKGNAWLNWPDAWAKWSAQAKRWAAERTTNVRPFGGRPVQSWNPATNKAESGLFPPGWSPDDVDDVKETA